MKKSNPLIRRRLILFISLFSLFIFGVVLVLVSFKNNIVFFYTPTELQECTDCQMKKIKIGGMVAKDSVKKNMENLETQFIITDYNHVVNVAFTGIPPSLFKEEQGIVAEGRFDGDVFKADIIFAKHDENYMPPEVADALKKGGKEKNK